MSALGQRPTYAVQKGMSALPRKRTSAQRFDELPKLDCFLRAGAVPVISVPFALRRTTTSDVIAQQYNVYFKTVSPAVVISTGMSVLTIFLSLIWFGVR